MTFRTTSVSPAKGSLVLCSLGVRVSGNSIPDMSVTGGGMAWRELVRQTSQDASLVLVVFAAYAHHPVQNDFLEVSVDGTASVLWAVDEIPNAPAAPQNRMAVRRISGVDQVITGRGSAASGTLPFPAAAAATSRSWAAWFRDSTGAMTAIETPWVNLADVADSQGRLTTQMALGAVTQNTFTYAASAAFLGIVIEVAAADAGHLSAVIPVTHSQAIEATIGSGE